MQLNPSATYDCLFIGSYLQRRGNGFSATELHLLSYLSCLLSLYRQMPIADWDYTFVGTEFGAPFSKKIDEAVNELLERNFFQREENRLQITERAEEYARQLSQFLSNQDRTVCLEAACASITAFSIGMVCNALSQEPDLRRAQDTPTDRFLLEDPATSQLYQQFDMLRHALNQQSNDLRMPAVVWLETLYRASERTEVYQC